MKKTQLVIGTLISMLAVMAYMIVFRFFVYGDLIFVELDDPTKPTVAIWIALFVLFVPLAAILKPKQFKGMERPIAVIPASYVIAFYPASGGFIIMIIYGLEKFGTALVYVSLVLLIIFMFKTLRIYSEEEESHD